MTIREAIRFTEGKDAGIVNRASVQYAETLLLDGEEPSAAVIANITTAREHFPGVVVLTDRRVLAVCGLPGIKRMAACGAGWTCQENPSAIRHKFTFSDGKSAFSVTLDPDTGERFSRHIAFANGDEHAFDEVPEDSGSGILNPALLRSKRRARQTKAKQAAEASPSQHNKVTASAEQTDIKAEAQRLSRQLEEARSKGRVADTDPMAVAARLAAELAEKESD